MSEIHIRPSKPDDTDLILYFVSELAKFEVKWSVLDWNRPVIRFYDSIGARPQKEWIKYRLSGISINKIALS